MLDVSSQSVAAGHGTARSGMVYNLLTIGVLVLLLAVGTAYLIDMLGRGDQVPAPTLGDTATVTQTIAGKDLAIPTTWFRFGEQIRSGFTDQIDLKLGFAPEASAPPAWVNVTLLPRSRARTSASLLDRVYLHQFANENLSGVSGLVGKPMNGEDGYAGETVWYDALSPNPFVAKCQQPVTPDADAQCVRTVHLASGIAAVYTFDARLLEHWRQFDDQMALWLRPIGAL